MPLPVEHDIFFVSDGTGITIETLGHTLITQFPAVNFQQHIHPFIKSKMAAQEVVEQISSRATPEYHPLVFMSIVDPEIKAVFSSLPFEIIDIFSTFLPKMEQAIQLPAILTRGEAHGLGSSSDYHRRISTLNFALEHDDGLKLTSLDEADIILIGVSRCGKTPTCLYLAMHYLLRAANYPLTEDDFHHHQLPPAIKPHRHKLFGLTISPQQLCRIREERRPSSRYASLEQCAKEIDWAETLYNAEHIPYINTSSISIEEIATTAVQKLGLKTKGKW